MILDLPLPRLLANGPFRTTYTRESPQIIQTYVYTVSATTYDWIEGQDQRILDRLASLYREQSSPHLILTGGEFAPEDPYFVRDSLRRLQSASINLRGNFWRLGREPRNGPLRAYGLIDSFGIEVPSLIGSVSISDALVDFLLGTKAAYNEHEPILPWEHLMDPINLFQTRGLSPQGNEALASAEEEVDAILAEFPSRTATPRKAEIRNAMVLCRFKRAMCSMM